MRCSTARAPEGLYDCEPRGALSTLPQALLLRPRELPQPLLVARARHAPRAVADVHDLSAGAAHPLRLAAEAAAVVLRERTALCRARLRDAVPMPHPTLAQRPRRVTARSAQKIAGSGAHRPEARQAPWPGATPRRGGSVTRTASVVPMPAISGQTSRR